MTTVDLPADMVTTADFDLDGVMEYVLGRRNSRQLLVRTSLLGSAQRQATIALESQPIALSNGDFNGDGRPELAIAVADARLEVLVSDSYLNFSLTMSIQLPASPRDLDVQTADGHPSLVVATTSCVHVVDLVQEERDDPRVSQSVRDAASHLASFRRPSTAESALRAPQITAREREVLLLALKGLTARQIGKRLFIGDRTVETHLAHGYGKLGVRSRFELLARLSDDGLLERIA